MKMHLNVDRLIHNGPEMCATLLPDPTYIFLFLFSFLIKKVEDDWQILSPTIYIVYPGVILVKRLTFNLRLDFHIWLPELKKLSVCTYLLSISWLQDISRNSYLCNLGQTLY